MDRLDLLISWLAETATMNLLRSVAVIIGIPFSLYGANTAWKWWRGQGIDGKIELLKNQVKRGNDQYEKIRLESIVFRSKLSERLDTFQEKQAFLQSLRGKIDAMIVAIMRGEADKNQLEVLAKDIQGHAKFVRRDNDEALNELRNLVDTWHWGKPAAIPMDEPQKRTSWWGRFKQAG